jgi:hypothetical protein
MGKKIRGSISITKSNATDYEQKLSDVDVIEGRLEVGECVAISLSHIRIIGDIIAHDNAIISLPDVKETGNVIAYPEAEITLASATKTGHVRAYQGTKIILPKANMTENVSAGENATIILSEAKRTGGVVLTRTRQFRFRRRKELA